MSLAIEALRQVCETGDIEVQSVTLRDVDIKTALVVPETDNGIEIQFRFQATTVAESATQWYSYAVESITDNRWTTHCEGRIAANHNHPASSRKLKSPVDLSSLTQRVPGKRWYEAFKRVGFEYGPTFQSLSQIRTNNKYHKAAASVDVTTESKVMDGESRYILHPLTIDACLQLIIISINAGLHKKTACGVVPLQMEEVNLWLPNNASSQGHAVAWTDELNGRYFNTHTKLATDSGELVLDVKSMRCVSYEAAVPQNATPARKREPYMGVSWKPDVTTLTSQQALQVHPTVQSEVDAVIKIIQLINHKCGLDDIFLLGESLFELVDRLREQLSSNATFTVGCLSADTLDNFESSRQNDRISAILLPEDVSKWSKTITEKHSLFVFGKCMLQANTCVDLLNAVKPLIAENGSLISVVEDSSNNNFVEKLDLCGGFDVGFQYHLSNISVVYSQLLNSKNEVEHDDVRIMIVTMDPHRCFMKDVAEQLRSNGSSVKIKNVSKANVSEATKIIIDDIKGTMMSNLATDDFEALQKVLCSSLPIIWLTTGVNQGKTIFGGMS